MENRGGLALEAFEKEFRERLIKVEERAKSNTHQISELKPVVTEIHIMSKTMIQLVEQVKTTNSNVEELKDKVGVLEREPSARLTQIKTAIITALTTAVIGGVIGVLLIYG